MQSKTQIIGITTTVPSEILYAANFIPVDLNNIFIANENPDKFVEKAEIIGFPGNSCAWIKGIFSA
ncbi:MAG: 2-hydroxyacyl-CoA dehydratase, partial [Candidatus Muirbacterium halophilum]|nr:2-hydroxyacyl-CoA dehydratase [Candidatus Muirbacterium halophilum]